MRTIVFITFCLLACLADNFSGMPQPQQEIPCHFEKGECPSKACPNYSPLPAHSCRWDACPYKGVQPWPGEWNEAVYDYTDCEEGTDCYYIDMLHLQFPDEDYDQLEDRLWQIEKDSEGDASDFHDRLETAQY